MILLAYLTAGLKPRSNNEKRPQALVLAKFSQPLRRLLVVSKGFGNPLGAHCCVR
jgi:hypothetical protein